MRFIRSFLRVIALGSLILLAGQAHAQVKTSVQVDKADLSSLGGKRMESYRKYRDSYRAYKQEINQTIRRYKEEKQKVDRQLAYLEKLDTTAVLPDSIQHLRDQQTEYEQQLAALKESRKNMSVDSVAAIVQQETGEIDWERKVADLMGQKQTGLKSLSGADVGMENVLGKEGAAIAGQMEQGAGLLSGDDPTQAISGAADMGAVMDAEELAGLESDFMSQQEEWIAKGQAYTMNPFKGNLAPLDQGHEQLARLKKKYIHVPDINDLSTAKRKSSLQGESLGERFFLGGTNAIRIKPVEELAYWNISLMMGYRVNKNWRLGTSAGTAFIIDPRARSILRDPDQNLTARIFTQYTFWREFFGHVEGERIYPAPKEETTVEIQENLNLGLGRYLPVPGIKKAKGFLMVVYQVDSLAFNINNFKVRFGVMSR